MAFLCNHLIVGVIFFVKITDASLVFHDLPATHIPNPLILMSVEALQSQDQTVEIRHRVLIQLHLLDLVFNIDLSSMICLQIINYLIFKSINSAQIYWYLVVVHLHHAIILWLRLGYNF